MKTLNFVVVGNISYDYNYFPNRDNQELKEVMNYGGATLYSGLPASAFTKVGIAAKVGEDYDLSILEKFNLDLSGVKRVPGKTTMFKQVFTSADGQLRDFSEFVNPFIIFFNNFIPTAFLKTNSKYFKLTNFDRITLT